MEAQLNHSDSNGFSDADSFVPWDNPDNVITYETYTTIEDIINCYFNPIIFCISVPANVLNCVVFLRQGYFFFLLLSFFLSSFFLSCVFIPSSPSSLPLSSSVQYLVFVVVLFVLFAGWLVFVCVCVCVCVCVRARARARACVRVWFAFSLSFLYFGRGGGGGGEVVDLFTFGIISPLEKSHYSTYQICYLPFGERWENFLLQDQLSVLTLISASVPPHVTAVERKGTRSFSEMT